MNTPYYMDDEWDDAEHQRWCAEQDEQQDPDVLDGVNISDMPEVFDFDDHEPSMQCGACGGTVLVYLGELGSLTYFRCRACGMELQVSAQS